MQKKTIVVVEDRVSSLKLFHDLLDNQGYNVMPINNGAVVVDTVLANNPDLIVMDIQLPGKSGIDLIPELKNDSRTAHIPILAVSAFTMENDVKRIMAAGPDDFMTKPFNIMDFVNKISSMIAATSAK